jgi:hypothetical protein
VNSSAIYQFNAYESGPERVAAMEMRVRAIPRRLILVLEDAKFARRRLDQPRAAKGA